MRLVVDEAGAVVDTREWTPYGEEVGGWQAGPGYTGEWWDAFLTRDPFPGLAALPQTQHPYVYVGNNPVNLTDASGEFAFLPLLLVGAAGGALGGMGYYALRTVLNPCAEWNWGEALFWTGAGTVIGAALGGGIYGGWWVGVQLGWWGPTAASGAGTTYLLTEPSRINWPWHHVFPQRPDLAAEFMRRGIDINRYLMQLLIEVHRFIHSGAPRGGLWNQAWEAFFAANPTATAEEIYRHAGWLIYFFNLEGIGRLIIR